MPHYICNNPFVKLRQGYEAQMYHSDSPRYFSCVRSIDLKSGKPIVMEPGHNFGFMHITPEGEVQLFFILVDDNLNRAPWPKLQKKLHEQAQFYIDQFALQHYKGKDKKGSWSLLRDYNAVTPGLKIILLQQQDIYLVSHRAGICTCDTEDEVFDFLIDLLEYPEELLEQGDFNVINAQKKPELRPFSLVD